MTLPTREQIYDEVDATFFDLRHPDRPRVRLDPDDPAQAQLIEEWNEIYRDHLNNWVDHIFRKFFPHAPERLDPNNPDDANLIEYWIDIRDTIRDGTPSQYNWNDEPSTPGTSSSADATATPTAADPARPGGEAPDTDVEMDEDKFKEFLHLWLEGVHWIFDTSEVVSLAALAAGASEHAMVVVVGEALGPVGMIAATIVVLWAVVHAFGTGLRMQEQQGFCYGVMWQAFNMANGEKGFIDWFDDTAEELHDAFYEGVAAGREKANDIVVHNKIMLAVSYYQLGGDDLSEAQSKVLNELWLHIRESDKGADYLLWPNPASMQGGW
jgi:hypothetical protein